MTGPNSWETEYSFSSSWFLCEYMSSSWSNVNGFSKMNVETGLRSRSWKNDRIDS